MCFSLRQRQVLQKALGGQPYEVTPEEMHLKSEGDADLREKFGSHTEVGGQWVYDP